MNFKKIFNESDFFNDFFEIISSCLCLESEKEIAQNSNIDLNKISIAKKDISEDNDWVYLNK